MAKCSNRLRSNRACTWTNMLVMFAFGSATQCCNSDCVYTQQRFRMTALKSQNNIYYFLIMRATSSCVSSWAMSGVFVHGAETDTQWQPMLQATHLLHSPSKNCFGTNHSTIHGQPSTMRNNYVKESFSKAISRYNNGSTHYAARATTVGCQWKLAIPSPYFLAIALFQCGRLRWISQTLTDFRQYVKSRAWEIFDWHQQNA